MPIKKIKADKKFLKEQKEKLGKAKARIEESLSSFGSRDERLKTNWIIRYPKFGAGNIEEEADEVEEYDNMLSINLSLEKELKKIIEALEKIKKQKYGLCDHCQKPILKQRLKVYPQAKYCTKCKQKYD